MSSFIKKLRRSLMEALPDDLEKIIRCIGAPKKCLYLKGFDGAGMNYAQDSLWALTGADFMTDPLFSRSYKLGEATGSWKGAQPAWRCYVACWAARNAVNLEGDFVECGVNRGGMPRAIMEYVDFNSLDKKFWLLDTYRGFDKKQLTEAQLNQLDFDYYDDCYESVCQTFKLFPGAKIVRGTVPDTLSEVTSDKVSYLSIDMNIPQPEIAAAEYFWDKLVPGAVVLLDDYNWPKCKDQKQAFDDFAKKRNIEVLSMPTGQGLMIKV